MRKYSSRAKTNSRQVWSSNPALRALLFGALLIVLLTVAPRFAMFLGQVVTYPVVAIESWVQHSSARLPTYIRTRGDLDEEIRSLKSELRELREHRETVAALEAENDRLRAFLRATTTERIAAVVIARPTALPYDVFLIDRGAEHGVEAHAPIYTPGDRVIGFVAHVMPRRALVVLASSPGMKSSVYIFGPNIYTTATGLGGGTLRVNVPQGIALQVGDSVVLPSLDRGVFGTIAVVESEATRPEQYGYVTTAFPLASISHVTVGQEPVGDLSFSEAEEIVASVRADLLDADVPHDVLVDTQRATTTATSTATTTEQTP